MRDAKIVGDAPREEPFLVPSITEDDEDDIVGNEDKQAALSYLLRYETMVRQQEAEDLATLNHLQPCLQRLEVLAGISENQRKQPYLLTREISYSALRRALRILDESDEQSEHITTDRQLMMVLRLMTQKAGDGEEDGDEELFVSWAEVFQAYKTCIAGMLTLQHLPPTSTVRSRARDRTLALLSLYGSPTTKAFEVPTDSSPLTKEKDRVGSASYMPHPPHSNGRIFGWVVVTVFVILSIIGVAGVLSERSGLHLNTATIASHLESKFNVLENEKVMFKPVAALNGQISAAPSRIHSIVSPIKKPMPLPTMPLTLPQEAITVESMNVVQQQRKSSHTNIMSTVGGGIVGAAIAPFVLPVGSTVVTAIVVVSGIVSFAAMTALGIANLIRQLWKN